MSVPALWIVPDWIGSGQLFHAGDVSQRVEPSGTSSLLAALAEAATIVPLPLLLAAAGGLPIARRIADRWVLGLSAIAVGWTALLVGLMLGGYPASARFFVLPASLLAVLGAVGGVRAVGLVMAGGRRVAIVALIFLATLPAVATRIDGAGTEARASIDRARVEEALGQAIARVGPGRLRACGVPVLPRGLGWIRGEVAWRLRLSLRDVRGVHTTGAGYLARLSRTGKAAAPRAVAVRRLHPRFVLLDPFGRSRLGAPSPVVELGPRDRTSRWRIEVPRSGPCAGGRRTFARAA